MPEPSQDPASLAQLVERCSTLCASAEDVVAKLGRMRASFLAHSLADTLQQLELILGALDGERSRKDTPQGVLKRMFARGESAGSEEVDLPPVSFDLPHESLQGTSWTVSIAELLGFLAYGRKTGVLWVDSPREHFLLGFVEGALMHATSDRTPRGLRLGEILVGLGFMTRRQLESFLERQAKGKPTISGEVLLLRGMISDEELRIALTHQVQRLVQRLVATEKAVFRFREGMQIPLAHQVRLDVNALLLETARLQDEARNAGARPAASSGDWGSWSEDLSDGAPAPKRGPKPAKGE